jgi:gamma-glutamylaminecyclotransferase
MLNDDEQLMQELSNDSEFLAWCDEHTQEAMEMMLSMSDAEVEAMYPSKHMVFVYGSLKRGFGNHRFLEHSTFIGTAVTVQHNFCMHPLHGSFPAVTIGPDDSYSITGELYEIDNQTLKQIDMLESNGVLYTRQLVSVYNGTDVVEAWIYLMPDNDKFVTNSMVNRYDRYVHTDFEQNTQEWFQD